MAFLQVQKQAEGAETVLDGMVSDTTFSLGGFGAGGFLGVYAIGHDPILAGIFRHTVPLISVFSIWGEARFYVDVVAILEFSWPEGWGTRSTRCRKNTSPQQAVGYQARVVASRDQRS